MTTLDERLLTTFREHERQVRVPSGALERVYVRHRQRRRRQRAVVVVGAGAVMALAALGVMRLRDDASTSTVDAPETERILRVDAGAADDFEPLQVREVDVDGGPGLFVHRDRDDSFVALSRRNPRHLSCRLELATVAEPFGFEDPCHGLVFDSDGIRIGGPGVRGMYSHDAAVVDGRVIVDLTLTRPGPVRQSLEGGRMSLDRLGEVDEIALEWWDTVDRVAELLRDGDRFSPLWPLGVFHDAELERIQVLFTYRSAIGELMVGSAETWPHPLPSDDRPLLGAIGAGDVILLSPTSDPSVRSFFVAPSEDLRVQGGVLNVIDAEGRLVDAPTDEELLAFVDLLLS